MHTEELPPPLSSFRSDLPENVESVALTAMAVDPDARYQSAAEMAEALELAQQSVARPKTAAANPWKTLAFVVAGILLLSAFLIYATWMKRTDPATVLQPDANGLPVQPINPATGAEEQSLAIMPALTMDANSNVNSAIDPGMYPGGDSYNPWAAGGAPPPGAPPIGPPGSTTTVVTSPGNPFNPPADCPNATWVAERNAWLCDFSGTPPATRPTPTPRSAAPANANTATQPAATPTQRPTAPGATPRAQPTRAAPSGTATPPESDAPIERDQR
jgi:hypothetical protein